MYLNAPKCIAVLSIVGRSTQIVERLFKRLYSDSPMRFALLFDDQNVNGRLGAVADNQFHDHGVEVAGANPLIEFSNGTLSICMSTPICARSRLDNQCHAFPQRKILGNKACEMDTAWSALGLRVR